MHCITWNHITHFRDKDTQNTQRHNLRVQLIPFLSFLMIITPRLNNILNNIKCPCAVVIRVRGQTFIEKNRGCDPTQEVEWREEEAIGRDQIYG
jgi:hypothetical protein